MNASMIRRFFVLLTLLSAFMSSPGLAGPPLVLAAASLQESMNAAADAWARRGHPRPIVSFAASSALARQIASGAPADLFVSADEEWMDDLERRGLLRQGTRANFLANRLVLVGATSERGSVNGFKGRQLAARLAGTRIAMADPESVPAGRYGKAALEHFGIWQKLAPNVVRAENVRAALALVERGAARYGMVYATDARASAKVRVVGVFPQGSHAPIRYPIAELKASTSADASGFRRFLLSQEGRRIFGRFGFGTR